MNRVLPIVAAIVVAATLLGALSHSRSRAAMDDWMDHVRRSSQRPTAQRHVAPAASMAPAQLPQSPPFALRDGEECRGESAGWPGVVVRREVQPDGSTALVQVIDNGRIVSCMAGRRLH